jgi:hypothetical protein
MNTSKVRKISQKVELLSNNAITRSLKPITTNFKNLGGREGEKEKRKNKKRRKKKTC